MDNWITENHTNNFGLHLKIKQLLHAEQTDFQKLEVVQTEEFGNMLLLDGLVMTSERDEFVYHEMITHPALYTHPNPKSVLVVGGGDGGTVRQVVKHQKVEKVTQVEIDGKVMEYSKKFFPAIAKEFDNPKVEVLVEDGYKHILENKDQYDVILLDSTEPAGLAAKLVERGFYHGVYEALKEDGLFVAQSDNPWFKPELIQKIFHDVFEVFPITRMYTANIPTYPSGLWTFTIGSKKYDPLLIDLQSPLDIEMNYYTPNLHYAAFQLPKFVYDIINVDNESKRFSNA